MPRQSSAAIAAIACTRGLALVVTTIALLLSAIAGGCERKKTYAQETPDDVLRSAVQMVKDGQTEQLPSLIYADNPEMRATLAQLGRLLGDIQKLSKAVASRFPQELEDIKKEAQERAARGEADSIFDQILKTGPGAGNPSSPGRAPGRNGPRIEIKVGATTPTPTPTPPAGAPADRGDARNQFRELINQFFVDPYAWLEKNGDRLGTQKTADDSAVILLDNGPLMAGLTLPMQLADGKWYIVLPLNLPGLSDVMPKTQAQWSILRSIIQVFDKTVIDMTHDVQTGAVTSLDNLARNAQQKVMFPAIIAFGAYGKEFEVGARIDRRTKSFQDRQKLWAKSRAEQAGEKDARKAVSSKLLSAMNTVAPAEIEKLVRANQPSKFDQMTDAEFEEIVGKWLNAAGLKVRLDQELSPDKLDPAIKSWDEARKKALNSRPAAQPKK